MDRISSRVDVRLLLYLRFLNKRAEIRPNGNYIEFARPTLVHLLDALEIPYTFSPGRGRIFFSWIQCTPLPDLILDPKYSQLCYDFIKSKRPFVVANQEEFNRIESLFSIYGSSLGFYIDHNDQVRLA